MKAHSKGKNYFQRSVAQSIRNMSADKDLRSHLEPEE